MSLFSFFSKKKHRFIGVIDIGSSSVGVAVARVAVDNEHDTNIVYSSRKDFVIKGNLEFKKFFLETTKALKEALANVSRYSPIWPEKYVCFLSSPFYLSRSKTFVHQNDKPFLFTEELLKKLALAEAESFKAENKLIYQDVTDDKPIVVEDKIMGVKLNGYEALEPFGKEALKAEITQYVSLGSARVLSSLREIIAGITHQGHVEFHSFAFAAFSTLRDMFGRKQSFIVADISGETTDLTISENGQLVGHVSFPCGKQFLLRSLTKTFGSVHVEAESMLRLYREGRLSATNLKRVENALERARQEWLGEFKECLESFGDLSILPNTVYLVGEDETCSIFADWLRSKEFGAIIFAGNNFDVKVVGEQMFSIFSSYRGGGMHDNFMLLEAIFCAKIIKKF